VQSVELKDGRVLPCGLVVMAVGIRANAALAASGGLQVKRGIVVDDGMQTSVEGIYAIGECAEHRGVCYGLVEPCYEQARVAASAIAGEMVRYPGSVLATNLKVSGVSVFSAGDFEGVGAETIVVRDAGVGSYRKLVVREDRLAGAVLVGDTAEALWYADLIRSGAPVSALREALAFGQAFAEAA
jgi:nitrite reductase (NADH) large subunit